MKKSFLILLGFLSVFAFLSCSSRKSSGKIWIIATDTVFPPFEYMNEKNQLTGIDIDILKAVSEDQGFRYELQELGWDAAVASVQVGQADAVMAGATITPERIDSGWIFSDGYFYSSQTFVVPAGSLIDNYEMLRGRRIAVKNGTMGMKFAESLKDKYDFKLSVFEDSPSMYQDVLTANSAACVEDMPIIKYSINTSRNYPFRIPEGMDSEGAPYGMAVMKPENQVLIDMFNTGLKNIKETGKYQEIIDRYLK